ncbi:MAG: peptidoglycan-binding protein [Clostridia bacterium]|nr:peptidoglycan-binding protein [Clostridia bacterium]
MTREPYVPREITVHLGAPGTDAPNVRVPFAEYIKNVASSEIYPTWPEQALRANIYAQISFALNRVFTEWYRNQGYPFDITNSTRYDQAYVPGRNVYDNVSLLVDDLFTDYVRKAGHVEPYFTQYCNGTTTRCDGLSQWGTVEDARQGLDAYEILQKYYGDDIEIVRNTPVRSVTPSYPGMPLRMGDAGNDVRVKQVQLNRISANYPGIPKIAQPDGVFGQETEDAVRAFQEIFGLAEDGIIGRATWYEIAEVFVAVKGLAELESEGLRYEEIAHQYPDLLRQGDTGVPVQAFQYYLAVLGRFYESIPEIEADGIFGNATREAVLAAQREFGLREDGIVGRETWQAVYSAYRGVLQAIDPSSAVVDLFPGTVLRIGSQGAAVSRIQQYLNGLSQVYSEIPEVPVTGRFGVQTQKAVTAFQQLFGLEENGIVGPIVWAEIVTQYETLQGGMQRREEQYPGYPLTREETA